MANLGGDTIDIVTIYGDGALAGRDLGSDLALYTTQFWQMAADGHASASSCTWVVTGAPDTTATSAAAVAAIAAAALATPVRNIRIVTRWTV